MNGKMTKLVLSLSFFSALALTACAQTPLKSAAEASRQVDNVSAKSCEDDSDYAICVNGKEVERNTDNVSAQGAVPEASLPYFDDHHDANIN